MDYTSPWAGAHYRPIPDTTAQAKREASQGQRTYEQFKTLSASEPDAGIKFVEGIEYLENPPAEYLDKDVVDTAYSHLDEFRVLDGSELPAGVRWGARYRTFVVNSPVYCAFLLRKIVSNGGRTKECTLSSLEEAFSLDSHVRAVVNCSGRGFGDPKSFIIRGIPCSCLISRTKNNCSRPNMSRPESMFHDFNPPKRRRELVFLRSPSARWRDGHRGH